VAKAWAGGKLPRAILIAGPESALREEALAGVRQAAFGQSDGGLNWVVLYGPQGAEEPGTLRAADILDEVFTRPMFGGPDEPKVTVVRRADRLLMPPRSEGADGDEGATKVREILERNLERIPAGAVLVFEVAQPGQLVNTRFGRQIAALGGVVRCDALASKWGVETPDSALGIAVEHRARALGLELEAPALMALIERSGHSLAVLEEEQQHNLHEKQIGQHVSLFLRAEDILSIPNAGYPMLFLE
jgi:hypothetical protein